MKTKFLLGALGLTAAFAACTNEDIVEANVNNAALEGRKVVDMELVSGLGSRLTLENGVPAWEDDDKIGSILVDPANLWEVEQTSHLGNNRWDYVDGKFTTEGTTVEGAWMFYYPYSGEMSKTRAGLKAYNKSLVNQEYDADGSKMYENDFRVSPVYFVNAAEGGAKIDVQLTSIYAYGNIKAALPQAAAGAKVSKVLIEYTEPMTDSLTINAEEVAKLASMNYAYTTGAVTQTNPDGKTPADLGNADYEVYWDVDSKLTSAVASDTALYALQQYKKEYLGEGYTSIAKSNKSAINYILIDCKDAPALADTMFTTRVLLPTGEVDADINLYIYTDKGVYSTVIEADANNTLLFKRGLTANLHNVNRIADTELVKHDTYLKTDTADATTSPIVETADLVNLIKQHNPATASQMDVTQQLMGTVVLNDAVAEALAANNKVTSLKVDDINIACTKAQTIEKLVAVGDVTVKAGSNITIGGAWSVAGTTTIETGATVTVAKNCGVSGGETYVKGSLNINNKVTYTAKVSSEGAITLGNVATDSTAHTITAYLIDIKSGSLTINAPVNNATSYQTAFGSNVAKAAALTVIVNQNLSSTPNVLKNATVTNNATLAVNTNQGVITNNKTLTVAENDSVINNNVSVITSKGKAKITTNNANGVINTVADSQTDITTNNGIVYYAENAFINGTFAGSHEVKGNIVYKVAADMTAAQLAAKIQQTKVTAIEIASAKVTVENGFENLKALAALRNISMKGSAEVIANDTVALANCPIYVSNTANVISGTAPVAFVSGASTNYNKIDLAEGADLEIKTVIYGVEKINLAKNAMVIARTNVYGPGTEAATIVKGANASWLGTAYEQKATPGSN